MLLGICLFILLTFGLAQWLEIPLLQDPRPLLEDKALMTVVLTILILALDILLPIPSTVVMVLMGSLFGPWLGGLVSLTGIMLSSISGYYIGVYAQRFSWLKSKTTNHAKAQSFVNKWGDVALIASRGIPVLSESIAILAGTQKMPFKKFLLAALLGLTPSAFICSFSGAFAFTVESNLLAVGLVLAMAGVVLAVKWMRERRRSVETV